VIAITCIACGPRGETRSLDEVVANARELFYSNSEGKLAPEVKEELVEVAKRLDMVASNSNSSAQNAADIARYLDQLIAKAGYTSRPALGELFNQWTALANAPEGTIYKPSERLLAARTFFALGSELEGVRFSLEEREKKL